MKIVALCLFLLASGCGPSQAALDKADAQAALEAISKGEKAIQDRKDDEAWGARLEQLTQPELEADLAELKQGVASKKAMLSAVAAGTLTKKQFDEQDAIDETNKKISRHKKIEAFRKKRGY